MRVVVSGRRLAIGVVVIVMAIAVVHVAMLRVAMLLSRVPMLVPMLMLVAMTPVATCMCVGSACTWVVHAHG